MELYGPTPLPGTRSIGREIIAVAMSATIGEIRHTWRRLKISCPRRWSHCSLIASRSWSGWIPRCRPMSCDMTHDRCQSEGTAGSPVATLGPKRLRRGPAASRFIGSLCLWARVGIKQSGPPHATWKCWASMTRRWRRRVQTEDWTLFQGSLPRK